MSVINSMVTQRLLPIGYSYENRLHSNTEIKKNINILSPTKLTKAYFFMSCCNDFVLV
jgi:hypothetical protein